MGFIGLLVQFIVGGVKALFGRGGAKVPPKPVDVVSEQAATAPTMAATAARDEQALTDAHINHQAQEAAHAQANDASNAAADARARIVRQPTEIDAGPAGHWRD